MKKMNNCTAIAREDFNLSGASSTCHFPDGRHILWESKFDPKPLFLLVRTQKMKNVLKLHLVQSFVSFASAIFIGKQ
jgi:hypothetical protein